MFSALLSRHAPLLLAAGFFLAWLPFAATFVTFHPDERHYVDAAAEMVASGDYLTPHTAEGDLRFHKPVATYWLIVPWYRLFGISPLAGRLSFLALSATVVWLTYHLAKLVYAEQRTALLAAAIMATHAPLLTVAVNSIPEVPLTLCWMLCAYGFLGIMVLGRREPLFYWAAYGGAGLGMAVKGLPILVLVLFAIAFARWNPWRKTPYNHLLHWPSMAIGAAIGLAWYVAMFALHGEQSLAMFVSDQVVERVGFSPLTLLKNGALVLGCYAVAFFPWSLPLVLPGSPLFQLPYMLRNFRASCAASIPGDEETITRTMLLAFVLLWGAAMGIIVALVDRFALRYLLAVTPLGAVVLADYLARLDAALAAKLARQCGYLLAGGIALVAISVVAIRWQLSENPALLVVLLLALGGIALAVCRLPQTTLRLTLASLLLFPLGYLGLEPLALPDSGETLAAALHRHRLLAEPNLAYAGNPALISKARVLAPGDLQFSTYSDTTDLALEEYELLLFNSRYLADAPHGNYVPVGEIEAGLENVKPAAFLKALVRGQLKRYLAAHRQRFTLLLGEHAFDRGLSERSGVTIAHEMPPGQRSSTPTLR